MILKDYNGGGTWIGFIWLRIRANDWQYLKWY